jgi:exopolyphosphatase/guanosine-5'-triphosphate,3'-diphosphate pyrophosphatase
MEAALQNSTFAQHLLCLRIAVIACHARDDVDAAAISMRLEDGAPVLRLAADWAETHPRALHLLRLEIDAWSKTGLARTPRLAVG